MLDKFSAFSKYCRETSLPGWSYLGRDINPKCKIVWAVFLVGILVLTAWFVKINVTKYIESTTVTTIESTMASLKDVSFPSVYICSTNQVIFMNLWSFSLVIAHRTRKSTNTGPRSAATFINCLL